MDRIEHITLELQHSIWADLRTGKAVAGASGAPARAEAILHHIVGADWLWLRRLGREGPEMAVWPALSRKQCVEQLHDLARAWRSCLDALVPADLARGVAYRNSKGEAWTSTVGDILTHVVLHSSYHRGQIATLLRDVGVSPPYTDYIEFIRRGHGQDGWPGGA
jgi:uncharacterized damage-inducible protein DinB